jgi:hypothetical protein
MTIDNTIIAVRYLLNENNSGQWADPELYVQGLAVEKDIIKRVHTKYLSGAKKTETIVQTGTKPFIGSSIHRIDQVTDYLRFSGAEDTAQYKLATLQDDMNDIKINQSLPSFAPSSSEPICFFDNDGTHKILVFCPFAPYILFHYFKIPTAWASGNSPLVDAKCDNALKYGIVAQAFLKDINAMAGNYIKLYEEEIVKLGG